MEKRSKYLLAGIFIVAVILLLGLAIAGSGKGKGPNKDKDGSEDNINCKSKKYRDDPRCNPSEEPEGPVCGNGICEEGETSSSCPTDCGQPDSCSDSDGGFNTWMQGTVSGYKDNNEYSKTDFCLDETFLLEYYCSGTTALEANVSCDGNSTTSCSTGKCV